MLVHYKTSIHMNVTLTLHAKLSLSRDRYCKTHVNQRLFPFSSFTEIFMLLFNT